MMLMLIFFYCITRVAESPECEMGIDNLAKIFGPTVVGYGMMTQAAEMYTATAQMFNVSIFVYIKSPILLFHLCFVIIFL